MVDLQCALVSPLTRILRKRHCLWYAHTNESIFLRISTLFVNNIVTSTRGSFPFSNDKVRAIGQAVDPKQFKAQTSRDFQEFTKVLTYGRLDISKRADEIIESVRKLREVYPKMTLSLIGTPGNVSSADWASNLQKINQEAWLTFKPSVPRREIGKLVSDSDVLFHAYLGSLDKVLIEASFMEIPIVTINPEYHRIFGTWGTSQTPSLISEYESLTKLSFRQVKTEVKRRRDLALQHHSTSGWINQLVEILSPKKTSES